MLHAQRGQRLTDPRQGTVVRVEVSRPPYRTRSGIRVGSTQQEVMATYPGQLKSEPHAYAPRGRGEYLTLQPTDPADRRYGVRFVITNGRVEQILAGDKDAIQLVEGCA